MDLGHHGLGSATPGTSDHTEQSSETAPLGAGSVMRPFSAGIAASGGRNRGFEHRLPDRWSRSARLAAEVASTFDGLVVVDDHTLIANTIVDMLLVLGVPARTLPLSTREALVDDIAASGRSCVLLDLTLGGDIGDATDLIPSIVDLGQQVVVVTADVRRLTAARCYEAGAAFVLTKGEPFPQLLEALARTARGGRGVSDNEYYAMMHELRHARAAEDARLAPFARLTDREGDILERMCGGLTIAETAKEEFISETTVRSHIRSIFLKLNVRNQLAAAAAAYELGWLEQRRAEREKSSGKRTTKSA